MGTTESNNIRNRTLKNIELITSNFYTPPNNKGTSRINEQQDPTTEKRLPKPKGIVSTEERGTKVEIEDNANIKRKISSLGTPDSDINKKKSMSQLLAREAKDFNEKKTTKRDIDKSVKFEKSDSEDDDLMEVTNAQKSKNFLTKEELEEYTKRLILLIDVQERYGRDIQNFGRNGDYRRF